jgi:hypothetical protein
LASTALAQLDLVNGEPLARSTPERTLAEILHAEDTGADRARIDVEGAVLRRAVLLILAGALLLLGTACSGDGDDASDTSAASTTARHGEPIVIREKLIIAATEHSEPIATGQILAGSKLGGSPFCAGGTIRDTHASLDPKMEPYLIDRKITCPDGTVRIGFTPEVGAGPQPQGQTQKGSWAIVSGTRAFERLRGTGKSETVYGSNPKSPVRETLTGTATH